MYDRLDALTIFVAVAEQQSFTEAARQLSRSPASVTRAVAALEERLQTRLFNRTTRSVALTDAGARYLENCRRLLAVYDELEAVNLAERVEPRPLQRKPPRDRAGRRPGHRVARLQPQRAPEHLALDEER